MESKRKETPDVSNKVVTLKEPQKSKLDEIRGHFGWSARRASSFILAHNLEMDSVISHATRLLFPNSNDRSSTLNLFIPMTSEQMDKACEITTERNYDFTHLFKMEVDKFYDEYKPVNFRVNFNKNDLTKKFEIK